MRTTALILFLTHLFSSCQAQDVQKIYAEAKAAYNQRDYSVFYTKMKEAYQQLPSHQTILYQLGIAAALTGHAEEAIEHLNKAILINADYPLDIPDLVTLKNNLQFKKLEALKQEWLTSVVHSDTAFVINERDLHAEGIDYDPGTESFYVGSIHKRKIVRITKEGKVSDFCQSSVEGMTSVFAMKINPNTNVLWACASPVPEMMNNDSTAKSAVYEFELSSGTILQKYELTPKSKAANLGDLILDRAGDVFVSDGENNEILVIKNKRIAPLYSSKEFMNIQGITFSSDERYLFIADYVKGIYRLELATKKLIHIETSQQVSLIGIDGLYFYHNSLIAIQNGVRPSRCTQYNLNIELDTVESFRIVDRNHPSFGDPTLGAIVANRFYYIANSQWGGYRENHSIKPVNELKSIIVLKCLLN